MAENRSPLVDGARGLGCDRYGRGGGGVFAALRRRDRPAPVRATARQRGRSVALTGLRAEKEAELALLT